MRTSRKPRIFAVVSIGLFAVVALAMSGLALQPSAGGQKPGGRQGRAGGGPGLIQQMSSFQTEVPAHPFNIVLVRPTFTSITVSIVSNSESESVDGYVEFGERSKALESRTAIKQLRKGEPALFVLEGLTSNTAYSYRWRFREVGATGGTNESSRGQENDYAASDTYSFHTQRPATKGTSAGSAEVGFTFSIQADSHLDANMNPAVYLRALANALADKPDFHVDLGDTFMTDKRREFKDALPQYSAQRYYFGQLCHSAPLFMVLGNHDGEYGYAGSKPDEIAGWSFTHRTNLFPPPEASSDPAAIYSGRTSWQNEPSKGGANYYAFHWGDALLVVLDPFWPTRTRPRGGGGPESETTLTDQSWTLTLGREQYDWLDRTLAASRAPFKFVFIHHLVGGLGKAARGGVESAPYFEWGGKNADGTDGFAAHRPGWPMPIHQLLVKRGVSAVFHGHDHLFVQSELDGIVYQCVPQPGNPRAGTRSAEEYGYKSGTILGSPGHLRVTVTPASTRVAFIRASSQEQPATRRGDDGPNGSIVTAYELKPRGGG